MATAEFAVRRSITSSVRAAVIARDGMVCVYCQTPVVRGRRGAPYRPNLMHLDHVVPWASGGDDSAANLVVSCARCNLGRGKPRDVVRQRVVAIEFRHGAYWWPDDYTPPKVLPDTEVSFPLRTLIDPRRSLVRLLQAIHRGDLAASASGKIYVALPDLPPEPQWRRGRRRRVRL